MVRLIAAVMSVALIGTVGLACNSIAGLDGIDGRQCSTRSECQELGECVKASCDDGFCRYELADLRSSCSAGICDAKARCVECIEADDCTEDPFLQLCTDDGRCVECLDEDGCKNPERPRCFNNVCVQCVSDMECEPLPEPCLEARCAEGGCLVVTKPAMEPCPAGECDGKGACIF